MGVFMSNSVDTQKWFHNMPNGMQPTRQTIKQYVYKPSIVLGIQQEVCANDSNADSDDNQNEKHEQHEPIDIVDLVRPEWREDKIPATYSIHYGLQTVPQWCWLGKSIFSLSKVHYMWVCVLSEKAGLCVSDSNRNYIW